MIQTKIKKGVSRKALSSIFPSLTKKRVLITGAAGSIGSELSIQVASLKPSRLVLVDMNETEIFYHELRMRELFPSLDLSIKIADIKDSFEINSIIKNLKPDLVFHAAAYKHIPLMEENPRQAVLNNIHGTVVVAKTAKKYNVGKFVFISTDKAADPIGVMGATKKLAELYLSKISAPKTSFIIVRFGNVLGSRGSVVPIIENQIKNGQPVTLTDPEMKRYFMTIPEAVFLVLQAAKIGKNNETFILDMGRKIKITELANKIIRAYGKVPGKDIEITFIGKRPGEKIEEQLISNSEITTKTKVKRLLKISNSKKNNQVSMSEINKLIEFSAETSISEKIKERIFSLIEKTN